MIQIDTSDSILIDGQNTGLKLTQRRNGTVIYTPEQAGQTYAEHAMPYARYSAAHDAPSKPGQPYDPKLSAGSKQLEADVRALAASIKADHLAGIMKALGDKVQAKQAGVNEFLAAVKNWEAANGAAESLRAKAAGVICD